MNILKKALKKLKNGSWYPFYNTFYERLPLARREILLESRNGTALESNIFAICRELEKPAYRKFRMVLSVGKTHRQQVEQKLKHYGISVDKIVNMGSAAYYFHLARAGYLVNDSTFPGRFIKKDGQVYLNVWHGTPLKKMGRDNLPERHRMGNVLRNLLMSDYLLYPNSFMEEKMSDAFSLRNLYQGTVLREGYPRNSLFFDREQGEAMKKKLGFQEMQLSIYMPTYRGNFDSTEKQEYAAKLRGHLKKLDRLLDDGQLLLVKMHPFVGELSMGEYRHIRPFPAEYDTYEVLNACDVLITDYSSVFYDFASTGRKIILFAYDREEYGAERGMYEDISSYPFHLAETPEEVAEALKAPGGTADAPFLERYCTYENANATERICRHVFLGQKVCSTAKMQGNGKKNVYLYGGGMQQNGITTAFCSLLDNLDRDKYNFYVSFRMHTLKDDPHRLDRVPEDMDLYPLASEMSLDLLTGLAHAIYIRKPVRAFGIEKRVNHAYEREWKKHFTGAAFDYVLHCNGYEAYIIALLQRAPCPNAIWVHSNMDREIELRHIVNEVILRSAYKNYDKVVMVAENLRSSTLSLGADEERIKVVSNCHNYKKVLEMAEQPIVFDESTASTVSLEQLKKMLEAPGKKFVSVGRFSPEKNHEALIRAFHRFRKDHPDTCLIIIGGRGELYDRTLELVRQLQEEAHVVLIRSLKNPMPVVKRCDLFVLSSLYEGLPMTLFEAATLGLSIVSTDIPGPARFLGKYGGLVVECSEEGLREGMERYLEGKVPAISVDFQQYNQEAIREFESLLS